MQHGIPMDASNPLRAADRIAFNEQLQAENRLAPFKAHGLLLSHKGLVAGVAVEALLTVLVLAELSYCAATL